MFLLRLDGPKREVCYQYVRSLAEARYQPNGKGPGGDIAVVAIVEQTPAIHGVGGLLTAIAMNKKKESENSPGNLQSFIPMYGITIGTC